MIVLLRKKKSASFSANLSVKLSDIISTKCARTHAAQSTCVCVHVKLISASFACERGSEAEMKEETRCRNLQKQER